ncbi:MAG: hypothetical protein LBV00_10820 [Propionibacteriaceae bacterium]|jgi:hypothetical protein|nr:hypothetical protein [Propionibacteriaceae bacterium]
MDNTEDYAMADVSYVEFKCALLADYYDQVDHRGATTIDAITHVIDEVSYAMWANPIHAVCAITTVAIVALREGFLPDYMADAPTSLDDIADTLTGDSYYCARDDRATLTALLQRPHITTAADYPPEYFVT